MGLAFHLPPEGPAASIRRLTSALTSESGKPIDAAMIWLVALCIAIPAMGVAQSADKKTLVGVWEVKISPKDAPAPLLSIAIFGGDGSFTTSVYAKFPPVPPFGPSFGECPACHQGRMLVIEFLPRSPSRITVTTDTS